MKERFLMNNLIQFTNAIDRLRVRLSGLPSRYALRLIPLIAALALLIPSQARGCPEVCDSDENTANTAFGEAALIFNASGTNNTAFGFAALNINYTGNNNTAIGAFTLLVADGSYALF